MKCSELQFNLPLYADGSLDGETSRQIVGHLAECPLCRQRKADLHDIRVSLSRMTPVEIPSSLRESVKRSVRSEIRSRKTSYLPFSPEVREWLQMQLMPYSVGVAASLLIGVTFLTMMFSAVRDIGPYTADSQPSNESSSILLAANIDPFFVRHPGDISPAAFAQSRRGVADESPSVNPQGALIALTKSLIRGGMKDDEVVVVADVFGNGLAQIAEVVEPSRDRQAVAELERALRSDPAFAPFIPTNVEDRPESVRVVLRFQSVNVNTGTKPRKRR